MPRFFSPIFIQKNEFWPIKLALNRGTYSIRVPIAYHGLVTFTPICATNLTSTCFYPEFIGNPYPRREVDSLRGCDFRYVYTDEGDYDAGGSESEKTKFSVQYDEIIVTDICVPKVLKEGDILLCSKEYPLRGDRLREIQNQIFRGTNQLR